AKSWLKSHSSEKKKQNTAFVRSLVSLEKYLLEQSSFVYLFCLVVELKEFGYLMYLNNKLEIIKKSRLLPESDSKCPMTNPTFGEWFARTGSATGLKSLT